MDETDGCRIKGVLGNTIKLDWLKGLLGLIEGFEIELVILYND